MRRSLIAVAVLGLVAALAPTAEAGTTGVSIVGVSAGFSPSSVAVGLGEAVQWTNGDMIDHTTTQLAPLGLWNSGHLSDGGTFSFTFTAAGTYPYHCAIHSTMTGQVRVAPQASLLSNGKIKVIAGSEAPASGFVLDIQLRQGRGAWQDWRQGLTKRTAKYQPQGGGRFSFRARLRREAGGESDWSPGVSIRA